MPKYIADYLLRTEKYVHTDGQTLDVQVLGAEYRPEVPFFVGVTGQSVLHRSVAYDGNPNIPVCTLQALLAHEVECGILHAKHELGCVNALFCEMALIPRCHTQRHLIFRLRLLDAERAFYCETSGGPRIMARIEPTIRAVQLARGDIYAPNVEPALSVSGGSARPDQTPRHPSSDY